jgi:hypothetical protein
MEHFNNTALVMAMQDIERALQAKLFYLALVATLTLPEICAALESSDGDGGRLKYEAWYDKHLAAYYPWLTSEDCYGLRCGIVHQGHARTHTKKHQSKWNRVLFILPTPDASTFRNSAGSDAYITSVAEFCLDVVSRVRAWAIAEKDNPIVKKNAEKLMRFYPKGLKPYVFGVPLFG